jgi:hypothetical protein
MVRGLRNTAYAYVGLVTFIITHTIDVIALLGSDNSQEIT